jgi:hypothetical protein
LDSILVYYPSSKRALLRAITIFLWVIYLVGIDLLKLFISPALKHILLLPTPNSQNCLWTEQLVGVGVASPPWNLGFLRNVLMRRQATSSRFLSWAFWGHSLVQPPHQEGSYFRERETQEK